MGGSKEWAKEIVRQLLSLVNQYIEVIDNLNQKTRPKEENTINDKYNEG